MEKFSVLMPVYYKDNPLFFERALTSITVDQTIMPDEILIVEDGPIGDSLHEVVNKFKSKFKFIKTYQIKENRGLGNALRIGVELCTFDYIARMDSDDISMPQRFEQQLEFIKNNKCDAVGSDVAEFAEDENDIKRFRRVPKEYDDIVKFSKRRCPINHPSVMFKKHSILSAGNYRTNYLLEDYDLWVRLIQKGFIILNTGTVLLKMRADENLYIRRGGIKYFYSMYNFQKFLFKTRYISWCVFITNLLTHFIVKMIMTGNIRKIFYGKVLRNDF